ncbi:MAG: hypothetical protein AAB529_01745 [Patescibacteria group bacterium]
MKKWEYETETFDKSGNTEGIDSRGQEGWEVCSVDWHYDDKFILILFKREIPEPPANSDAVAEEKLPRGDQFGDPWGDGGSPQSLAFMKKASRNDDLPSSSD